MAFTGSSFRWPGVTFPWDTTLKSYFEIKDNNDNRQLQFSIMNIVMTSLGERVMRPTFGTTLTGRVFEQPEEENISKLLEREITDAVRREDTRIVLLSVQATHVEHELTVKIAYREKESNEKNEFSFVVQ